MSFPFPDVACSSYLPPPPPLPLFLHTPPPTPAQVIAALTVGKDMSPLFADVVNCMQTGAFLPPAAVPSACHRGTHTSSHSAELPACRHVHPSCTTLCTAVLQFRL